MRVEFKAVSWAKEMEADLPPAWEHTLHVPGIGDYVFGRNESEWKVTGRFWLPDGNMVTLQVAP